MTGSKVKTESDLKSFNHLTTATGMISCLHVTRCYDMECVLMCNFNTDLATSSRGSTCFSDSKSRQDWQQIQMRIVR